MDLNLDFLSQYHLSDPREITESCFSWISQNYNYCYLYSKYAFIREHHSDSIAIGSSYGLCGIRESLFHNGCVNLSMHSQDYYYCLLGTKKAVESSDGQIKRCFMILGYYTIGQDISREKNFGLNILRNVYQPLLQDFHHLQGSEPVDVWQAVDQHFPNREQGVGVFSSLVYHVFEMLGNTYYNQFLHHRPRANWGGRTWPDLSDPEKLKAAISLVSKHNKFLRYEETIRENEKLLNDFALYLTSRKIDAILVIPPFPPEYLAAISPVYKETLVNMLDDIPGTIHFIDMNETPELWGPEDFIDTDHMSERGADKLSRILNDMFCT